MPPSLRLPALAWGLAGALLLPAGPGTAQGTDPVALSLRDAPVGRALEDLVSLTGISLVYSSRVVADRTTVCRLESADAEALLRCIVQGAGLDFYRLSSGTYVVIGSREELPAYGSLSGRVVDAVTGEPLPRVRVELGDGSRSTFSDDRGVFLLPRLLPGPHRLVFSRSGYQPLGLPLEILSAANTRRQIRLDPTVLELDPLVVEGMRNLGTGASGESSWRGEGFEGAVPRSGELSRQAREGLGVARRPLFADLSIQGSAPGEHMIRLDGVPVFDPVSLGRSRSAFSPLALRRITVRKAGFGVDQGSFTGGVIDVEHGLADRNTGPGGVTALADPYSANADVSFPVAMLGGEGVLMVAGRTSLWDIYQEPALDRAMRGWNRVDPVLMDQLSLSGFRFSTIPGSGPANDASAVGFTDVHSALRLELPGFRTVSASFYRGTNRIRTDQFVTGIWTPDVPGASSGPTQLYLMRDQYDWSNTAGQVSVDWLLGDRASLEVRGWGSRHLLDHRLGMAQSPTSLDAPADPDALRARLAATPAPDEGNRIQEWGAGISGDLSAGSGHFLSAGVEAVGVESRTYLRNRFLRPIQSRTRTWRVAGFVQDRWRLTRRLSAEAGLRFTSVEAGRIWTEPRLALRLDGSSSWAGPWSVRLAGGVYRQFLNRFSLTNTGPGALVPDLQFWLPVDGTVAPPRSRHVSLEVGIRPAARWEVRGEMFYKALDRILALDYGTLAGTVLMQGTEEMALSDFVGEADGVAYGAGVRAGWEEGRARFRVGYDWTVSERTFPSRFQGARQPTPWMEPHRLVLQGRVPVAGGIALDAEARGVWGRTWALRRAYYDYVALTDPADALPIGLPGDDPLPTLYTLDVGVSWLGRLGGSLTELRAEVRNAQPERQVLDYSLVEDDPGTGFRRRSRLLPGPALLFSARIGF